MSNQNSIWVETEERPCFPRLEGKRDCDVLIIGGGMAGLLCAYLLRRAGVDCVLLEAERICGGITKNTTAKITLQHGLCYDKMIRRFGRQAARIYVQAQQDALNEYRALCQTISCDYEEQASYVYSCKDRRSVEREMEALQALGVSARFTLDLPLPFAVAGAVCVERQAQFHPLRFAYAIAKELPVYENSRVLKLAANTAKTARGSVFFRKAILATHFPFINTHGMYVLKLYQHRSYVLALDHAPRLDGMYVDADLKGLSFRSYGDKLLLGGGSHRTGKKGGGWRALESVAQRYYPGSEAVFRWATQDCMSLDGIPYIGQYAHYTPNWYVATGFSKWGMSSSMVAAMRLRDQILGKQTQADAVFSPMRSMLRPQLAINTAESVRGLLTPTVPRCPHLGCALKYNAQEHSWDCPCHGSRFEENGDLIDNPATNGKSEMSGRLP